MAVNTKLLKRNTGGEALPQGYNPSLDDFVALLTGKDGRLLTSSASRPISSERVALTQNTVATLIPPASALRAEVFVESGTLRVRVDAVDPTATVGVRWLDGEIFELSSADEIMGFRGFSADPGMSLFVTYYGA